MRKVVWIVLLISLSISACGLWPLVSNIKESSPTYAATITPAPIENAPLQEQILFPTPSPQYLPTRVVDLPKEPTADPSRTVEPEPTQQSLLDEYLPDRKVVAESEHFIFYAEDEYFPVDQDWFVQQAEIIYDYVSQRLDGAQAKNKVSLGFVPPDEQACPIRGLASHNESPMVLIYADQQSPRAYILAVLAHELGHAIPYEGFPGGLPDALPLTEGLATWASGEYWADWMDVASLDDLVRGYISSGEYEPIHENYELKGIYPWQEDTGEGCLDRRDRIYSEWGSFLGYLIETYGWEKTYQLFQAPPPENRDGRRIEFPPDYPGIYGKTLNQLEFDWLEKLASRWVFEPPW